MELAAFPAKPEDADMGRTLLLIVTIGLAIVAASPPSNPKGPNTSSRPDSNAGKGQAITQAPIPVRLLNTGQSKAESDYERRQIDAQVASSIALTVITAALVFVGVLQWLAFLGQSKLARDALAHARDAATATLEQMQAEERRRLRAYVVVDSIEMPPVVIRDDGVLVSRGLREWPAFAVAFRNCGMTPARITSLRWGLFPADPDFGRDEPPAPRGGLAARFTLGAGGTHKHVFGEAIQFSPEAMDDLSTSKRVLFIRVILTYRDIFGDEWETPIFASHSPKLDPGGRIHFCQLGNDAT